ncbi:hypothetical protein CEXT_442801 [Caerostris extrusa]|uniref:Uncharacterized protein n=1 Tax=Caerostris extrusa TaxID=172846 RepID=A0AAV4PD53_CAEEX|nr:hypothetical protein CEXT_442801 [Caerostris extrusa]
MQSAVDSRNRNRKKDWAIAEARVGGTTRGWHLSLVHRRMSGGSPNNAGIDLARCLSSNHPSPLFAQEEGSFFFLFGNFWFVSEGFFLAMSSSRRSVMEDKRLPQVMYGGGHFGVSFRFLQGVNWLNKSTHSPSAIVLMKENSTWCWLERGWFFSLLLLSSLIVEAFVNN